MKLTNVFTPRRKRQGQDVENEKREPIVVEFAHCDLCGWTKSGPSVSIYVRGAAEDWYNVHMLSCPVVRYHRRLHKAVEELFTNEKVHSPLSHFTMGQRRSMLAGLVHSPNLFTRG